MAPPVLRRKEYGKNLPSQTAIAMQNMIERNKERKRQQHLDEMLAEWRRKNGYCPHCGEKL